MKKILLIAVVILGSCLAASLVECKDLRNKYLNSVETIKAYDT